ncbi:MAG: sodium:solute symporter [Candidatus Cyclobacteriaceae bacterium M3_2C_046]
MNSIDTLIFLFYMIGVTVLGGSFYRKNRSSAAFTLGNAKIPAWVVSLSIFATFVSSISYLALPGNAYLSDWNAFVFSLSLPLAGLVAVFVFVPLYRRINSPSAYTYLEQRFGPWARIYASTMYLLTQLMRIGTILYLMGLTLHTIFGWSLSLIIILTGLLVMVYSLLGGFQAVVWTDAIQAIVLISGALICAAYILINLPEGPSQIFDMGQAHQKFSLGSFAMDLSQSTFWVVLIYGLFINLQNFGIDQNYVQRYMASGSDQEAKRSALSGGLLYIPVSLLFLFIGTALFVFYQSGAASLPADLQDPTKSDGIFPYFIVNELPTGLTGLLIASIFAAGMSTISTSYNSSATVFLTDYYQRFAGKKPSDQQALKILYIASLMISVVGIAIALLMINVKSALDAWWKLASIFSGGMLGLFLLAVFTRTKNNSGAIAGVISGLLVIGWLSFDQLTKTGNDSGSFHPYLTIVFGTTTIFLVGLLVSFFVQKRSESDKNQNKKEVA